MRENADRFEGLAETYALYRPGYPSEAFAGLVAACQADRRIALDVGAGPGTSTRGLREALSADWLVTAIEPAQDMRRVLGRSFRDNPGVQVINAAAEELPLPEASAGLVVACGAFHWFEQDAFYAEAARVLAPGGVLGLMRNRRLPNPIIQAFDAQIARLCLNARTHEAGERRREPTVRELAALAGFNAAGSRTYRWTQVYDTRALIDLYLTRSTLWGIVRRIGLGPVMDDLVAIGTDFGPGPWPITYETTLKQARRR